MATEFVQANVDEIIKTPGDRAQRLESLGLRPRDTFAKSDPGLDEAILVA
jgi:hypothetical protein